MPSRPSSVQDLGSPGPAVRRWSGFFQEDLFWMYPHSQVIYSTGFGHKLSISLGSVFINQHQSNTEVHAWTKDGLIGLSNGGKW
ncbi:hypothetical protein SLE2022_324760 [Rubroshorea leprosula]